MPVLDTDLPDRITEVAPLIAAAVAALTIVVNVAILKCAERIGPAVTHWFARHRRWH
jgi:hypothetical protein